MFLFGLPPQQAAVYESLPIFLQAYSKPAYKPDVALIFGASRKTPTCFQKRRSLPPPGIKAMRIPKLQYSTFADFFKYVDEHYGSNLSTYKGDMGPYWEDGVGADAYYAAQGSAKPESGAVGRNNVHRIPRVNPNVHPPKLELDAIWKNIELFAEHTWTAGNSVSQPDSEEAVKQLAVKDSRATEAQLQIEDITNRSMNQLVNEIHIPAKTLVVFNALNWKRDAFVETDLDEDAELVISPAIEPVPWELLFRKQGFVHVRFMATDLPPVGYKCFQIRSAGKPLSVEPESAMNPVTENQYYRVTVDAKSGAIQSIFDKQLQRELVDQNSP